MNRLDLPPRPRILVVVLRRLGDVLLATPLLRSLRRAFPDAAIEALVFAGTEGMLAGNPDLDGVIAMPTRPSLKQTIAFARKLFRRYDLAVSTQTGDRPTLFAAVAGRRRIGFVDARVSGYRWKRLAINRAVPVDPANHRVVELLRLAQAAGAAPCAELVPPQAGTAASALSAIPARPYAVLHANPKFRYRRWTDEGWRALARALRERDFAIIATGGPDAEERAYLDQLWRDGDAPVTRVDGALDWPALTALLREAAVYVGPDTSMTHLSAAAGAPTVAIYGPASPAEIGPWPVGATACPWRPAGTIQRQGNVWLVQNPLPCLPCDRLGCENRLDGYSRCLDNLSVATVLSAVDAALATRARRNGD